MKKAFYIIIFISFSRQILGQASKATLILYTWGLQKVYTDKKYYDCRDKLSKIYGFERKTMAGCAISYSQERQWTRHNRKVERKLKKRNGKNWRDKYNADVAKCINEYSNNP